MNVFEIPKIMPKMATVPLKLKRSICATLKSSVKKERGLLSRAAAGNERGLPSRVAAGNERRLLSRAAAGNGPLVIIGDWKLPKQEVLFLSCETYPSRTWAMWRAKLFFLSNQKPLQPKNTQSNKWPQLESNLWMKNLPDLKYFVRYNFSGKTAGKSTSPDLRLI